MTDIWIGLQTMHFLMHVHVFRWQVIFSAIYTYVAVTLIVLEKSKEKKVKFELISTKHIAVCAKH